MNTNQNFHHFKPLNKRFLRKKTNDKVHYSIDIYSTVHSLTIYSNKMDTSNKSL